MVDIKRTNVTVENKPLKDAKRWISVVVNATLI